MKAILLLATALTSVALLAAIPAASGVAAQDARADFRQLVKDHGAAMKEFAAEVSRLEQSDLAEAEAYAESWNPTAAHVDLFAEAAAKYAGTEDAVPFLLWIVENDDTASEGLSAASTAALDTLIDQHTQNERFSSSIRYIGFRASSYGQPRTLAICNRVIERGEGELHYAGLYGRGVARLDNDAATEEDTKLARSDFEAIPPDTEIGKLALGYLFELDHLQIGMTAPDIADRDLDGVPFKLSDYRGKVVVLDFWGDW